MSKEKKVTVSEKYKTPVGRVSYPNVHEADNNSEFADGKYKITLLIPKETDIKIIKQACHEAATTRWPGVKEGQYNVFFQDGDNLAKPKTEAKGCWVVKFKSKNAPRIVGPDVKPLEAGEMIYGGCWARVSFRAGAYDSPQSPIKKSVTLYLQNVQKIKDDAPFGGSSPEDDFDVEEVPAGEDVI